MSQNGLCVFHDVQDSAADGSPSPNAGNVTRQPHTPVRAVVATRIYAPEGGAAAFRLAALVDRLKQSGYATRVLTTRPRSRPAPDPEVRRWPVLRDRSGAVRGYVQYASFDIPLFFRLLFTRPVDVVIVEPPPTTGVVCRIVCSIRRIPYVYFSADVSSTAAEGIGVSPLVVRILRAVESWVLRGASAVLAVTPDVGDKVIALGAARDKVTVVGTGIDTDLFSADGTTPEVGYPYLVYAGTMSEVHGASVFVEAFGRIAAQHPTARLKLFGQGVEVDALKRLAEGVAPGQVDFSEPISGTEIAHWLRGANAGLASVRPGRGYGFAFATKALATISCGTPVVYAGVGPLHQIIIENSLGWAADWDAADVAVAMDAALAGPTHERQRLTDWVLENYSLRAVAQQAVHAIDQVVG